MSIIPGALKVSGEPPSLLQWNNWANNLSLLFTCFPAQDVRGAHYGPTPILPQQLQAVVLGNFTTTSQTNNLGVVPVSWTAFPNAVLGVFPNWPYGLNQTVGVQANSVTLSGCNLVFWECDNNMPVTESNPTIDLVVIGW